MDGGVTGFSCNKGWPNTRTACIALVRVSHCCVVLIQTVIVAIMCNAIVLRLLVYTFISDASLVGGMYGPTVLHIQQVHRLRVISPFR